MERGSTLSLALSESNIKSGHHYIILQGYKFKLKWEHVEQPSWPRTLRQRTQQQQYLYLVTDETYPVLSRDWSCRFNISLNAKPQTINNGTPGWGYTAQGPLMGKVQPKAYILVWEA